MNTALVLGNLLAWGWQVSILVAVAVLVSLRWNHARAKLIFWQGILAIALSLPVAAPWHQPPPEALTTSSISIAQGPLTPLDASRSLLARICNRDAILGWIAAGSLARLAWIGVGFLRLRRLRLRAHSIPAQGMFVDRAVRWYSSEEISGPVTFGWFRPCVLLPARVASMPGATRDAIACHELLHVERRDWLFVLAEEAIRAALWFHPAIWFALARIQLAREQAVDEEVVRRTADREGYVDALLAVAGHRLEPDVAPAPLFLKKRQLAVRVTSVVNQTPLSRFAALVRFASAACAALAAVILAVWMFPFTSNAQSLPDDSGITCNAGAALLRRPPLHFPPGGKTGGLVVLEASVDSAGEVTDARVLSGPEELRQIAIENVLQWHYAPDARSPVVRVAIQFGPAAPPTAAARPDRSSAFELKRNRPAVLNPPPPPSPAPIPADATPRLLIGGNVQSSNLVIKVTPAYPPLAKQARIQGTVSLAVVIGTDGVVISVEVLSGDPLLAESAVEAVQQWVYKPTLLNGQPVEVATQVNVNFTLSQ